MFKKFTTSYVMAASVALAAVVAVPTEAHASLIVVDALANSSGGGTGVPALNLTAGQAFSVSVDPGDLWSAGPLPRWSNADGLTGDLFATGTDDSGEPFGTQIGQAFPLYSQGGLTAPYGTLVGEIGGVFVALGTSFYGTAWGTGTLNLYYWDENFEDNSEHITAAVAVSEPSAPALLGAALLALCGLFGLMRWRGTI